MSGMAAALDQEQLDSASGNRSHILSLAAFLQGVAESQNCTKHPYLCEEPFLCQTVHLDEVLGWFKNGFAADGHANPRGFCSGYLGTTFMGPLVQQCLASPTGDPIGAGLKYYAGDLPGGEHPNLYEFDASYCFINGMCDMPVTQSTTLQDSDKMCDAMFGREIWTTFPAPSAGWLPDMPPFSHPDLMTGKAVRYTTVEQTRADLISTCAMGNMHCDAMMCKETFCKDPKLIAQHGHYLLGDTFGKRAAAAALAAALR